jgi:phosphate starvation-inducible PhoH-like protein
MKQKNIILDQSLDLKRVFGNFDVNIKKIENGTSVRFTARGNKVFITGNEKNIDMAEDVLEQWISHIENNTLSTEKDLDTILRLTLMNKNDSSNNLSLSIESDNLGNIATNEKMIFLKSAGQSKMVEAIQKNDILFAVGPAGTGKTYLAVALAVSALMKGEVHKIVLARPAVEAGETLGFLPGDLKDKIDPYLKPLYDSLGDMLKKDLIKKYIDQEVIEIIPMAYMRGRTLNNAFIILDEAQNTTFMQMKMFLTRLGYNSKAIITGDITQIDLPKKNDSGLVSSINIISKVDGISMVELKKSDVVRHRLVQEIIQAYDDYDDKSESSAS